MKTINEQFGKLKSGEILHVPIMFDYNSSSRIEQVFKILEVDEIAKVSYEHSITVCEDEAVGHYTTHELKITKK